MAKQDIVIGAVAGVAAAALVPLVLLLAVGNRKPVIRALARGGRLLSDKTHETFAECQEIVEDLMAEMRTPTEASISAAVTGAGAEKSAQTETPAQSNGGPAPK